MSGSGHPRYALNIQLPDKADIVVKTEGNQPSVLEGGIWVHSASFYPEFHLIFDGAALTVDGVISGGSAQDWVTVRGGSKAAVKAFNIGSSGGGTGARIVVDGSGSELKIGDGKKFDNDEGATCVDCLRVVGGGKLVAESPVGVFSAIELGKESEIRIDGRLTLYAQFLFNGGFDPAALEGLNEYLPSEEYYLGEGTLADSNGNNTTYYTVLLKPDGTVATSLTLKWPEEEEPTTAAPEEPTTAVPEEPTTAAPEEPTTAVPEEPATAAPEKAKPDTGSPEAEEGPRHNDAPKPQAAEQEPESEPETEPESETESAAAADSTDDTGSKVVDATPYTGDRDGAGLWAAFAISSAAALCLAVPRLKSGRSRR